MLAASNTAWWLCLLHSTKSKFVWRTLLSFAFLILTVLLVARAQANEAEQCRSCHAQQVQDWQGSHHQLAMSEANEHSVLGDFSGQSFHLGGESFTLYKKDNGTTFWVDIESDGQAKATYQILYTFGVTPLQQYLVANSNKLKGRLDALHLAWDSRAKENGGQKWFHLYQADKPKPGDRLHWQSPLFNWNGMCADCHSSGLERNFDADKNRFATQWKEINVSCQSCHGDSEQHVSKYQSHTDTNAFPNTSKDILSFTGRSTGIWNFELDKDTAHWLSNLSDVAPTEQKKARQEEIQVCANCHSLRSPLTDGFDPKKPFLDNFEPSLIQSPLYHHDGQILEEVYVYGSFLQSKMFSEGVTCSDCHNPHSMALKADGNGLCLQCHKASSFDTPEHHFHEINSQGSQCVNCHMTDNTYMTVDPRRDHSFRVPRPDLSASLGSPNACNQCHEDQSVAWASKTVEKWYPNSTSRTPHYGDALHALSTLSPSAWRMTTQQLDRTDLPDLIRGSLLAQMGIFPSNLAIDAIKEGLNHDEGIVRLGALKGLTGLPMQERGSLAAPLLRDPLLSVRIEAARQSAGFIFSGQYSEWQKDFDKVKQKLLDVGQNNSWRAEGATNNALFLTEYGDLDGAKNAYLSAIKNDPAFIPSYINLADLYRATSDEENAGQTLRSGLDIGPKDPDLNHAYGLYLIRSQQVSEAIAYLEKATLYAPDNSQYLYVYAVALHSSGNINDARTILAKGISTSPGNQQLLTFALQLELQHGNKFTARQIALQLQKLLPNDRQLRQLIEQLK